MYYLTIDEIKKIYASVIYVSGGGSCGILDEGRLSGTLEQIQNDDYYPDIEDKTTHLFYSLNKNHCFTDGNKRISLAASIAFLTYNGYLFIMPRFINEMENFSIHVASGAINKQLLHKIIESIIYEDDYSEDLKLEIASSLQSFYEE